MVRVIMHGCNGRMGQVISGIVEQEKDMEIVAGVDAFLGRENPYPVFQSLEECGEADVVIDFSNAGAVDGLLDFCAKKKLPCVLCTTGLSKEQLQKVEKVSLETAVLKSANMSLGINVMLRLLQETAKVLAPAGFDMEIVEKHHGQKLDAPSGTALALADSINAEFGNSYEYVYDRSGRREKRPEKEIGISSVRGGSIVGEHDVIFAGQDEVFTISHTAYSRAVFARGAVTAASFLAGKPAGMYDMQDVIREG